MRIRILLALIVLPSLLFAQTDSVSKSHALRYYNSFFAGGLIGKDGYGTTLTTSMVHGVRFKTASFGLGIGYDQFLQWKSAPLFASVTFDIFKLRANNFYLQMNAGYSKLWQIEDENTAVKFENGKGLMINPMAGYRIETGKFSMYIAGGYKLQRNHYEQSPGSWIWGYPTNKSTVDQDINRMTIQIGIGLH